MATPAIQLRHPVQIIVRGKRHEWLFEVEGTDQDIADWRADGIDVAVVIYSIPVLIAELGLTRAWCFAQDVFNFRNPWSKR